MRRLFILLTAVGLSGSALGCHHTHGACDCDVPATHGQWMPPPPVSAADPILRPEPVPVMPKPAN